MVHYLIEFRFHGYAKRYAKKLIYDISKKFKVKGITRKKVVPHITLFGPFTTKNEKKMIYEVANVAKKYSFVSFVIKGFNYFNNPGNKVIYLDIEPSEELKQLRYELANNLKKISSSKSSQDRKGKDKFYFHATIAFKDIDRKFDRIWRYIKNKEEPNIQQYLLRITILKGRRILREYDLMQKRLLNRKQALSHQLFLKTVNILKQKEKSKFFEEEPEIYVKKQISFWKKLKYIFRISK